MPAIYDVLLRVSDLGLRPEDADSTRTITDQLESSAGAIAARGGKVGKTFRCIDRSGWTIWGSPEWLEAIDRVRRGITTGFTVAYDDRLGRNWRKAGRFFDDAEEAGADILIANLPGVDYRTDDGRTLTGILAVVAERTYLTARHRGNKIADAAMERGVPNRAGYGYRRNATDPEDNATKTDPARDAKALVMDETPAMEDGPSKAAVVARLFQWRRDKVRLSDMVKVLNDEGIPSPKGGRWVKSSVSSILASRQYTGAVTLGKKRPVIEGAHPAFVSVREWRRYNDPENRKGVTRNGRLVTGLAGHVLTCSGCGMGLQVIGTGDRGRVVYGCRRESSKIVCPRPVYVKKETSDEYVESIVLDALAAHHDMGVKGSTVGIAQLRAQRDAAVARLDAFVAATDPTGRAYAMGIERWEGEVDAAEEAYAEARANADEAADLPSPDAWSNLSDEARARIARFLLSGVRVDPPVSRSKFAPILDRFVPDYRDRVDV